MVEKGKTRGQPDALCLGQVSVSPQGFPSEKNVLRRCAAGLRPAVHRATIYCPLVHRACIGKTQVKLPAGPGWHAGRPMVSRANNAPCCPRFHPEIQSMTVQTELRARPRIAPAGLIFLAVTSVGWGLNWPIMKQILTEWPPLLGARLDRNRRRSAAGAARRDARAKPAGAAGAMAAAVVVRRPQRHDLDDADGAGAAVAARQRGGRDRLHHAGMGVAAGLARFSANGCRRRECWRW